MKELSIKEKAKRYDEAIKKAKYYYDEGKTIEFANYIASDIFPELKESEEERIRKDIISHFAKGIEGSSFDEVIEKYKIWIAWLEKQGEKPNTVYDKELSEILGCVICRYINDPNIPYAEREKVSREIIPYVERLEKQGEHANFINKIQIGDKVTRNKDGVLVNLSQLKRVAKKDEKQGEQRPVWSEEDSPYYDDICEILINLLHSETANVNKDAVQNDLDWLNSLKDRVQPQLKQEWSEEDEKMLKDTIRFCELCGNKVSANWLNSLKDKYIWKPSDEQMEQLKKYCPDNRPLTSLYKQLKKLKG